jgi:hypothetical protein
MYIIIEDTSIHHEGDQRSRDFPGHGYPAYTETLKTAKLYEDYDKFVAAVQHRVKHNSKFQAYDAKQYNVEVETTLKLSTND